MGIFAVACYKPRAGKEAALMDAVRDPMPVLRAEDLIEDRPAYVMKAEDGTVIEIFEWKSDDAIERAHSNPQVKKLWQRFFESCDFVPLATLPESKELFANFEPLGL